MISGAVPAPAAYGTARDVLEGFAAGRLSPVEVAIEALERIERTNDKVGAFLAIDERALVAAHRAEDQWCRWRARNSSYGQGVVSWQRLPTWGVPSSVKDTIEQEGLPTTYGSMPFAMNYQHDALVVRRLREAGSTLLGKTNTSEFALSTITANRVGPPVRNPWDLSRTAGGSSGGASAAAVSGIGAFALGTDSAGSIRLPAAYCGVYGFKPTLGTVPMHQNWRASPVRSHLGPIAQSVEDLLYSWRVLTGDREPITPLEQDRRLQVSLVADDPDYRDVLNQGLSLLHASDRCRFTACPVQLPKMPSASTRAGDWIFSGDHLAAAERLLPDFWERHSAELTAYARPIYEAGHRVLAWEYRAALDAFERYRQQAQCVFENTDVLITSTTEVPPVLDDEPNPNDLGPRYPLLSMWNVAGNPALVVPVQPRRDGLP